MFLLVAGISPKIKTLDAQPVRCPVCGRQNAYTRRVDHYLNVFFIPVLRVKKGDPFVICDRCRANGHPEAERDGPPPQASPERCRRCGRTLDPAFTYCPYCGCKR